MVASTQQDQVCPGHASLTGGVKVTAQGHLHIQIPGVNYNTIFGPSALITKVYPLYSSCLFKREVSEIQEKGDSQAIPYPWDEEITSALENAGTLGETFNCPNMCHSQGVCDFDGKCRCFLSWKGEDCNELYEGHESPQPDPSVLHEIQKDENRCHHIARAEGLVNCPQLNGKEVCLNAPNNLHTLDATVGTFLSEFKYVAFPKCLDYQAHMLCERYTVISSPEKH